MQKNLVTFDREKLTIVVEMGDKQKLVIDKNSIQISYFSGGPGGQHTNRHMNGVRLIYVIPEEHKRTASKTKELISRSMNQRSQEQNLNQAFSQLAQKVQKYFYVPTRRKKTRVPKGSKARRLSSKKIQSQKKQFRKKDFVE